MRVHTADSRTRENHRTNVSSTEISRRPRSREPAPGVAALGEREATEAQRGVRPLSGQPQRGLGRNQRAPRSEHVACSFVM